MDPIVTAGLLAAGSQFLGGLAGNGSASKDRLQRQREFEWQRYQDRLRNAQVGEDRDYSKANTNARAPINRQLVAQLLQRFGGQLQPTQQGWLEGQGAAQSEIVGRAKLPYQPNLHNDALKKLFGG